MAVDKLRDRVEGMVKERGRAYGVPCRCKCGCRVRHRFGEVCIECRDGRHWTDVTDMLDKIMDSTTHAEA